MLKDKQLECISSSLTIVNGLICMIYGENLLPLLPIICGSILLLKGLVQFIEGIKITIALEKIIWKPLLYQLRLV